MSAFTVEVQSIDTGWEFHNELVVTHNGVEIARECDQGEPEDNSFSRDYHWVAPLIRKAYELGRADGPLEEPVILCTRLAPHVCLAYGPCNGYPNPKQDE
jgi:hypothetical protein